MGNSDNDQTNVVLDDFSKPSDRLDKEALVDSRTQGAQIENAVKRNELFNKEIVDENSDKIAGIAKATLLDSISTNSGING